MVRAPDRLVTPERSVRHASDLTVRTLTWRFEEVLRLGDGRAAELVVDDALSAGLPSEAVQSLVIAPAARKSEGLTSSVAERMAKAADLSVELARDHFRRSEAYRELAFRDPLTDLANRRAFEDELVAITSHPGATGAVLMIDVDKFKAVNDERGHHEGDLLLRAIAEAITGTVRPGDVAARVGGDEFAVLLPETSVSEACAIGERVRAAVSESATLPVSLSVGVAPLSQDSRIALLAADTALYKAKAAGRDCVVAADQMPTT